MTFTTKMIAALALGATSCAVFADNTYQFELQGGYSNYKDDDKREDLDTSHATGKLYFNGVDYKDHVYGEAAFLERASNISVGYTQTSNLLKGSVYASIDPNDEAIWADYRIKEKGKISSANLEFWALNKFLYIAGGVSDSSSKFRGWIHLDGKERENFSQDISPNSTWNASVGVSPIAGLLIATDFYEDDDIDDVWTVRTKYVADWGSNAINVELGYMSYYDTDYVNAAFDFYFTRSFSLGAVYEYEEHSNEDDPWGVRARQFFSPYFSIDANYTKYEFGDGYGVGLSVRF